MAKSTGKLKYDLALSTTTIYDASSVYVNKSAELSINGNANLEYKTIGGTYSNNIVLLPESSQFPGNAISKGKAYLYLRNLGPSTAANIRLSTSTIEDNTDVLPTIPDGIPDNYDPNQIADLAVNEFAFIPVVVGASSANYYIRSGFISGVYAGATYNDIEYMLCYTTPNVNGPTY